MLMIILGLLFQLNTAQAMVQRDCLILPKNGCLLMPEGTSQGLVIYLRGHYATFRGHVPEANRADSIAEALKVYQLEHLAQASGMAIFVSASSHLSYDNAMLTKLGQRLQQSTSSPINVYLAAHSGGYRGMFDSLRLLSPSNQQWSIKSLIMLDNFYSTQVLDLETLRSAHLAGISCHGFFTDHNQKRFEKLYAPLGCQAQGPQGFNHVTSVKSCLLDYIQGADCHP
jgi:hypothetical protein